VVEGRDLGLDAKVLSDLVGEHLASIASHLLLDLFIH
jgi:hypothetical protein